MHTNTRLKPPLARDQYKRKTTISDKKLDINLLHTTTDELRKFTSNPNKTKVLLTLILWYELMKVRFLIQLRLAEDRHKLLANIR